MHTFTHYYESISDASNIVAEYSNARLLDKGAGLVEFFDLSDEQLEWFKGAEEFGPFPGDYSDLR